MVISVPTGLGTSLHPFAFAAPKKRQSVKILPISPYILLRTAGISPGNESFGIKET